MPAMGTPVDGDGIVEKPSAATGNDKDLYCAKCGYNLRGLDLGGKCPECSCDIADSLDARKVFGVDTSRRLANTVRTALVAHSVYAASWCLFLMGYLWHALAPITALPTPFAAVDSLLPLLYLAGQPAILIALLAWWLMIGSTERSPHDVQLLLYQRNLRLAVLVNTAGRLATLVFYQYDRFGSVIHLTYMGGGLYLYLTAVLFLKHLARPLGLSALARRTRLALWALALIIPVGISVSGMLIPASFVLIFLLRPLHRELRRLAPDIDAKD